MSNNNIPIKDHYQILEVSNNATPEEIKKTFRRLAQVYHPDKQPDNEFAKQHFIEIKTAYDILSDEKKRAAYDYELWISGKGKNNLNKIVSAEIIISSAKELNQYLHNLDRYSISYSLLKEYILLLLSDKNIGLLLQQNDTQTLQSFTKETLLAVNYLPFKYTHEITKRMKSYSENSETLKEEIIHFERTKYKQYLLQSGLPWLVVLGAIGLCIAMYWMR